MRESYKPPVRSLREALESCAAARKAAPAPKRNAVASLAAAPKSNAVATMPPPAKTRAVHAATEAARGARHTGARFAIAIICWHDGLLRPSSRGLFATLCWHYRPGCLYREFTARAAECAIAPRAARRARAELSAAGYISIVDAGMIIPAIEALLPPSKRYQSPASRQREFAFLATAPNSNDGARSARTFLRDRLHR